MAVRRVREQPNNGADLARRPADPLVTHPRQARHDQRHRLVPSAARESVFAAVPHTAARRLGVQPPASSQVAAPNSSLVAP